MTTLITLCLLAYIVGSIPTGKIIAALKGIDIQSVGTKNIGASNTFHSIGKRAAILVLIGDLGKAYIMMELALMIKGVGEALIVGLFLVLGNTHSIFLRFTGGKGVATGLGIFLAAQPAVVLVLLIFWTIGLIYMKYIFYIGLVGSLFVPMSMYTFTSDYLAVLFTLLICMLILVRHKSNIALHSKKDPEIQKV